jgi:hypothetical protein
VGDAFVTRRQRIEDERAAELFQDGVTTTVEVSGLAGRSIGISRATFPPPLLAIVSVIVDAYPRPPATFTAE